MANGKRVWWSVLVERAVQEKAVDSLLNIAMYAGGMRYARICLPYQRTDLARNNACKTFLDASSDPDDTLIMLDDDHAHPDNILERLARHPHEVGVVASLAFRRSPPFDPMFFFRSPDKPDEFVQRAEWQPGELVRCDVTGTGAVAIKRWVLERLTAAGYGPPWFHYVWPAPDFSPSEDVTFGKACMAAGIAHYVDTSVESPHLAVTAVDASTWATTVARYKASQQQPQPELELQEVA